jgi:superfamily I DNA/RNA helicase
MREIVLGPPGCGKTTTLLRMVEEELASGTAPDRIGYFSFTKKAAREAVSRACAKFSLSEKDLPYFRTLHSLCFRTVGLANSDVFDGKKVLEFGDWIGLRLSETQRLDDTTKFGFTDGDRALFMENLSRTMGVPLRQLYNHNPDGLPWSLVDRVSRGLETYKKARGLHDYTDMLRMFVEARWSPPLEVVFVDEAQDLSWLQWRVVDELSRQARRVVVAGDDDQAIYRWAGADVDQFVDMGGMVSVLGQSWRVPPQIQSVAAEVISRVRHRRPKEWRASEHDGLVTRTGSVLDHLGSGEDILILARNAFSLRNISTELRREGLLFEFRDEPSIARTILSSVKNWEKLRRGSEISSDSLRMIYALMTTGRGVRRGFKSLPGVPGDQMVDMRWARESGGLATDLPWYDALDRVPRDDANYLRSAIQRGERPEKPRIRLATIHGSKGGEADHVVLLPDMAKRTHEEALLWPEDEARVWYVASTRARRQLTLVKPRDRLHYAI